jgi:hypothetical protein
MLKCLLNTLEKSSRVIQPFSLHKVLLMRGVYVTFSGLMVVVVQPTSMWLFWMQHT